MVNTYYQYLDIKLTFFVDLKNGNAKDNKKKNVILHESYNPFSILCLLHIKVR